MLQVYPNPVEKNLYINFSEPMVENAVLEILDLTGKIMLRKKLSYGIEKHVVDVGQYNKGIYYIKVEYLGEVMFQKIIKE